MLTTSDSMVAQEQLYRVEIEQPDDPEGDEYHLWTAAEIGEFYPFLASLFVGDGTESLTYVHELSRIRINPLEANS